MDRRAWPLYSQRLGRPSMANSDKASVLRLPTTGVMMGDTYDNDAEADAVRPQQKPLRWTRVELVPFGLTEHGWRYE